MQLFQDFGITWRQIVVQKLYLFMSCKAIYCCEEATWKSRVTCRVQHWTSLDVINSDWQCQNRVPRKHYQFQLAIDWVEPSIGARNYERKWENEKKKFSCSNANCSIIIDLMICTYSSTIRYNYDLAYLFSFPNLLECPISKLGIHIHTVSLLYSCL